MKLTPHFTFEELTNTSHKEFLELNQKHAKNNFGRMYYLSGFCEAIRGIIAQPMTITSGYRCEELNQKINGVKNSKHTTFEAVDFIPKNMTVEEAYVKLMYSDLPYYKMILENNGKSKWIHISLGDKKTNLIYQDKKYILVRNMQDLERLGISIYEHN